jgi:hypothetical protein
MYAVSPVQHEYGLDSYFFVVLYVRENTRFWRLAVYRDFSSLVRGMGRASVAPLAWASLEGAHSLSRHAKVLVYPRWEVLLHTKKARNKVSCSRLAEGGATYENTSSCALVMSACDGAESRYFRLLSYS